MLYPGSLRFAVVGHKNLFQMVIAESIVIISLKKLEVISYLTQTLPQSVLDLILPHQTHAWLRSQMKYKTRHKFKIA